VLLGFSGFVSSLGSSLGLVDAVMFVIGLAFGSFGGMLASRIPRKLSPTGRSQCPRCGAVLSPSELIPVVSYLIQGGRCKHCGERVSGGYLLVELSSAVTFVLFHRYFGLNVVGILNMIVALHLTVLAGTDMMHGLLPNVVILSGTVFALVLRVLAPVVTTTAPIEPLADSAYLAHSAVAVSPTSDVWLSLRDGLLAAALGFAFFYVVALIKPGAMGGGDIKMAFFIGLYLGVRRLFPALGLGFVLSSLYAVPMMALGKLKRTDTLPLGIFLSLATIAMALVTV
jgi:prepilin signal peptidase PulO-like enzyme (type II secretory pathway)